MLLQVVAIQAQPSLEAQGVARAQAGQAHLCVCGWVPECAVLWRRDVGSTNASSASRVVVTNKKITSGSATSFSAIVSMPLLGMDSSKPSSPV